MNQNNNKDINEAILSGVFAFSIVFLSIKDIFSIENKSNFVILVLVYLFASICRIFGVLLESENIENFSVLYCRIILIPYTVWATTAIIFTEFKLFNIGSILSYYFLVITEYLIVTKTYGIGFKFRSPIVIDVNKGKSKKKN